MSSIDISSISLQFVCSICDMKGIYIGYIYRKALPEITGLFEQQEEEEKHIKSYQLNG